MEGVVGISFTGTGDGVGKGVFVGAKVAVGIGVGELVGAKVAIGVTLGTQVMVGNGTALSELMDGAAQAEKVRKKANNNIKMPTFFRSIAQLLCFYDIFYGILYFIH